MKKLTRTADNPAKLLLLTAILFYAPLASSCLGENLPESPPDGSGLGIKKDPFLIGSFESLACVGRGGYVVTIYSAPDVVSGTQRYSRTEMANGVDCSGKAKASWDFNAHYKLINNIDASRTRTRRWEPIIGGDPARINTKLRFRGSIDGDYHRITGLYINAGGNNNKYFISDIDGSAEIKNLGLDELEFIAGDGVAALVGRMRGRATISNCYVKGILKAVKVIGSGASGRAIGGLVGTMMGGTIRNSYAEVSLSRPQGDSNIDSGIAKIPPVGGLVGSMIGGTISNSYARGRIKGPCKVNTCSSAGRYGGLVGKMSGGRIGNSYAAVSVSETASINSIVRTGGLIGDLGSSRNFDGKNYYTAGSATGNGYCPPTNCEVKPADQIDEFDIGWNNFIWSNLGTGSAFPCLRYLTPGCNSPPPF